MAKIKNKLFQPLAVLVGDCETLYLQSREEIEVETNYLESPHLQALMQRGDIALVEEGQKDESESRARRR